MSIELQEEFYHGYKITWRQIASQGDYDGYFFAVYQNENLYLKTIVKVSRSSILHNYVEKNPNEVAYNETIHRIHAILDLGLCPSKIKDEYWIPFADCDNSTRTDKDIRRSILKSLYNIYKADPQRAKIAGKLDVDGFCQLLGISHSEYLFNAQVLRDFGYIEDVRKQQFTIENGGMYITAAGINSVELGPGFIERTPGLSGDRLKLLEQTILDAYPTPHDLRRMVRIELGENLDRIALGNSLEEVVFLLIKWAEKRDRIDDFIQGIYNGNPTNKQVQRLISTFKVSNT